jgi:DNA-binding CsgD family transcriptional regulator
MNARRQGQALDAALWGVAALVAYFSLQNVTAFAVEHGTPLRTAVVLAPMVDIALVAALVADGVLSRGGVVSTGWGTLLRWFAGIATLTFNVWGSVALQDIAAVVLHAVPPLLLILLAEAAPQYRRQFAALHEADMAPDMSAAIEADTRPDIKADTTPDIEADTGADIRPDIRRTQERTHSRTTARTSGRTSKPDTAAAVARLSARHPDWSSAEIARRLGVTDRTVRRHLSGSNGPATPALHAVNDA